ncbi:hypothetical protein [Tenacibaculum litopenaei]|uniref:hypothetical protein n=1 Tax=Tenacibaculum litopenaei TaxID=396016 RepID=UPI0038B4B5AE
MKTRIKNLGVALAKEQQQQILGGNPVLCFECINQCRFNNSTKEDFANCMEACRLSPVFQ